MSNHVSIREWQKNYREGKYDRKDRKTQCDAGWFDWFCQDKSLARRTKAIAPFILALKDGGKVDLDRYYFFMKNNCPASNHPLFDTIGIVELTTDGSHGEQIFWVAFQDKRSGYPCELFSPVNRYEEPIVSGNRWAVLKYLNAAQ
jgi:hypothetical protein